jgi:hypothetical protein
MRIGGRLPAPPRRSTSQTPRGKGLALWQSFFLTALLSLFLVVFLLYRQREWTLRGQRALVIVHEQKEGVRQKLTLVVVDPLQQDLRILPLPPQQYVITALTRYGAYQTDALAGLTLLENLDWRFLEQSLAREYGVVLDGVVWTDQQSITSQSDVRTLSWSGVLNQSKTTLAYWDRWTWWRLVGSVPQYQVELAPLQDWVDGDGRLRDTAYESWAETKIQDEQVRQSGLTVVVQNGSEAQGEANRVARMLRLIGYAVRNIDTIDRQTNTKIVLGSRREEKPEIAWAVTRLRDLYPHAEVIEDESAVQKARSDVLLILGQDGEGSFARM